MSESLNAVKATSRAARAKGGQATVPSEAGRQRQTPNLRWFRHADAEPQAVTRSEPRCSVGIRTRSNAGSGGAEPLVWWRRQNPPANPVARPVEPSGVAGTACGEGCSGESGRSGTVLPATEVKGAISATREGRPDAVPEVRGGRSSEEVSATDMDAKGLHFDGASEEATGGPSRPTRPKRARRPSARLRAHLRVGLRARALGGPAEGGDGGA